MNPEASSNVLSMFSSSGHGRTGQGLVTSAQHFDKGESQMYPQYEVNRKVFGTDYTTASMYWQLHGGILMEKLDHLTPWYVLQTKPSE